MVYVDALFCARGREWCHMSADTLDELHAFARQIGVPRCWYHGLRKGHPHYDLSPERREKAVAAGAKEVSAVEFVRLMRRYYGRNTNRNR